MSWRMGMLAVVAMAVSVSATVQGEVLPLGSKVEVPSAQKPPFSGVNSCFGQEKVEQQARLITVKVLSSPISNRDRLLGSGILVNRQHSTDESTYRVITNNHVLQAGEAPYFIETPDGKIHTATSVVAKTQLQGNDLALLQFDAGNLDYDVAQLGKKTSVGDSVIAGGFPLNNSARKSSDGAEFVIKRGQIEWVLDKALEGGYRIGYTNDVEKGMSGGPVLNCAGGLVGMNGLHAHPNWGDPYIFQDGSYPTNAERAKMSEYSWAIPMETAIQLFHFEKLTQNPINPHKSDIK
ncbi:S1 family peptidase [Nodularia spumigena]|uniref:S1 family peptidase n=1 Tax=Nodularia spumigena TaxID=70799 RepID=UPI000D325517|nr:serine protease [Nodularia spumigena]